MVRPFSPDVATDLIAEKPGRTAQQIVTDALSRGIIGTTGRDRLAGQMGALAKMYNEGRLPGVTRDESHRSYRYHPKGFENHQRAEQHSIPAEDAPQPLSFRPTVEQDKVLVALISAGAFDSRTEAIQWVLDQGIAAKREFVQKALETHKQIDDLRKRVKLIVPD